MTQIENASRYNPNEHLIQLKSKAGSQDYLPVQWRLVWFRTVCPNGTIDTEEVFVDLDREVEAEAFVWNAEKRRSEKVIKQAKGYARFRAVVTDGKGGRATATGSEAAVDFPDYIEKAETKAVGRALAALGYGTQFAPEFNEEHRIVDAPIDHQDTAPTNTGNGNAPTTAPQQSEQTLTDEQMQAKATDQQKSSIRTLCKAVGMSEPDDIDTMSFIGAKKLIAAITAEYKTQKTESKQSRPAQPAPAATTSNSAQSAALLNMISKSKQSVEELGVLWDDAKSDAGLRQVKDEDLTVQQVAAINKLVPQYKQRQTAKAS